MKPQNQTHPAPARPQPAPQPQDETPNPDMQREDAGTADSGTEAARVMKQTSKTGGDNGRTPRQD